MRHAPDWVFLSRCWGQKCFWSPAVLLTLFWSPVLHKTPPDAGRFSKLSSLHCCAHSDCHSRSPVSVPLPQAPSVSTSTQRDMIALVPHRLDLKPYWKTEFVFYVSESPFCLSIWLKKDQRTVQSGSVAIVRQGDTVAPCKHLVCSQDYCPGFQPFSYVFLPKLMHLPLGQVGKPWAGCYGNWWVLLAEGEGEFLELTQKSSGSRVYFSSASGFPACCSWIWLGAAFPGVLGVLRVGWFSPEDFWEEEFRGSVWPDCVSSWLLKLCWSHTVCLSAVQECAADRWGSAQS